MFRKFKYEITLKTNDEKAFKKIEKAIKGILSGNQNRHGKKKK